MSLVGSWRVASPTEPAAGAYGSGHAYYFSPSGELILSVGDARVATRILLTWHHADGHLHIDQPSAPRVDRVPLLQASDATMQIGTSWYVRETGPAFDDQAVPWALVAGACWHGVASAHDGEPFIPFLMVETGLHRKMMRIVTSTAEEAEAHAQSVLANEPYERAAWVRDGRITIDGVKVDAVLTARYAPGARVISNVALPYAFRDGKAVIAGAMQEQLV